MVRLNIEVKNVINRSESHQVVKDLFCGYTVVHYIVLRSTSGLISMTVLCSTIIAVASKSKWEKERNVLRMALREDMKGSGRS